DRSGGLHFSDQRAAHPFVNVRIEEAAVLLEERTVATLPPVFAPVTQGGHHPLEVPDTAFELLVGQGCPLPDLLGGVPGVSHRSQASDRITDKYREYYG